MLSNLLGDAIKFTPSKPGSGLGLYIASGIIEAHRGKIWAESFPDGAKFTFTLPIGGLG